MLNIQISNLTTSCFFILDLRKVYSNLKTFSRSQLHLQYSSAVTVVLSISSQKHGLNEGICFVFLSPIAL